MNIANSKALLLGLVLSCATLILSASPTHDGDKKPAKKDIIIVNIDEDLSSQLAGLAQYTYDLYLSNNKGTVTIKKYLESIDAEDASISHLVALITDLGVHESRISIKSEILTLEQPYFTLSVRAGPEVQ